MFHKKAVLFYLRNSHVKTVMETYFSRSRPERPFLIKVFSCKFFEISQNISLTEHQWRAPSKAKKNTLVSGNAGVEKNLHPGGPQFFFFNQFNSLQPGVAFGIRKTPTRKILTYQTPPWKIPTQKIPTWNIPTRVFNFFVFFIIVTVIIDMT